MADRPLPFLKSPRLRVLLGILVFGFLVLVLDRVLYDWAIYLPANHTEWDNARWYNLEYEERRIRAENRSDDRPLVLIIGSSIARYSYQEPLLEALIQREYGQPVRVRSFSHAAMLPTDIYFYAERIKALEPDLVVYLTAPADFDLERYTPPWEAAPAYSERAAQEYTSIRHPLFLFYPGAYGRERFDQIDLDRFARLQLYSAVSGLRMRGEWYDPVSYSLRFDQGPIRSYINYQGIYIPEGIFREGNTSSCFSFPVMPRMADHILLQVTDELFHSGDFHLNVYVETSGRLPQSSGELQQQLWNGEPVSQGALESLDQFDASRFSECGAGGSYELAGVHRPEQAGWQPVPLPAADFSRDMGETYSRRIMIKLSHVVMPGDLHATMVDGNHRQPVPGRGMRLPANLGVQSHDRVNDYLVRRWSWDDARLAHMSDDEYMEDYQNRLSPDDWSEAAHLGQFNQLRLSKYFATHYGFMETLQFRELKNTFEQKWHGMDVLVISNPENPLALASFGVLAGEAVVAPWYQGYLSYMRGLAQSGTIHFVDMHDRLPMQSFQDPHHLTYQATIEMAPLYAGEIVNALQAGGTR